MNTLSFWNHLFTAGLLLFSLILVSKPRLPALIRHFALASFCLAGLTVTMSILHGDRHGAYAAIGTVLFKVILIPWILTLTARKAHASMQLKFYLKPAATYFVAMMMLSASAFVASRVPSLPFIAIALVLVGLTLMIMRKDLYSQIIGFLTMENGIASFGVIAIGGIPILIEMGIFLTVTAGAIVMATLSHQIQEQYATGDTTRLTELTE